MQTERVYAIAHKIFVGVTIVSQTKFAGKLIGYANGCPS